jgi:predicted ATP-binding protein involved in virulence
MIDIANNSKKEFKKIKIQRVKIQHIKCFEDVEINFDPSGNTGLIIGANGKGKSTILQLIALGLSGISYVPFIYSWKEVVKKNHQGGLFEIDGLYDNNPIHLKFEIDGKDDSITCNEGSDHLQSMRDTFMLLAYGVNRSYKLEEPKPYKDIEPIATLFGENAYLKHIKVASTYEYAIQNVETIQALINKVLEKANGDGKVTLTHYDSTGFYFKTPSNPKEAIPIEALSEGFKSTLVWLFDAIIRIVERGGSLENAADVTGIILLDEVDLHLHPTWQRTILESVETLFPNIQFIVTSHSPFVVQSAKKECLIALEMEKDSGNVVVVDKDITSELSYSAIVDEIFNISFPFSPEIEKKMDKFREMANALRDNKIIDEKKFKKLVLEIASKGVELEGIMHSELMTLKRRTGKTFDLWKK